MTSKNLFWAKWMENIRRRGWTFALCFVVLFFGMTAACLIGLSSESSYLNSLKAQGAQEILIAQSRERMQTFFLHAVSFGTQFHAISGCFAVLFAIQGFSFLYSRKKMDFYQSVPVSVPKRYALIWGNGILAYAVSYLINLILCWIGGFLFGAVTPEGMAQSAVAFFVNILAFTAMYQLALVAVMLSGNALCALLGCAVLFFYEGAVRLLLSGLKSAFFFSYCSADKERLMDLPWLTPWIGYQDFCSRVLYQGGSIIGMTGRDSWCGALLTEILALAAGAAVFGLLAWALFRRRKAESYHQSLAFEWMKPALEILLVIPFALACGVLAGRASGDFGLFLFGGAALGALLGHGLIRLVYERDLKAVLSGRIPALCCLAGSVGLLCVFRFDLTGFDSWLPKRESVESVAFSQEREQVQFGWKQLAEDGNGSRDILKEMSSRDPETIDALISMISTWQEEERSSKAGETPGESWENKSIWTVRWQLTDGRAVYRRFYVSRERTPEELDTVMRDAAYQDSRYQIYEEAMAENVGQMRISYSTGSREYFYTMDGGQLLEALKEDFRSYGSDLIAGGLPCGMLEFTLPARERQGGEDWDFTWSYPVYESFSKTRQLLAQNGIDDAVTPSHPFLSAEDVDKITVLYYHYDSYYGDDQDELFAPGEIEEQQITCVFEAKDEIEELLGALYPGDLLRLSEENIADSGEDYRFEVRISLTPEALKEGIRETDASFIRDREPDFLIDAVRGAAVRK